MSCARGVMTPRLDEAFRFIAVLDDRAEEQAGEFAEASTTGGTWRTPNRFASSIAIKSQMSGRARRCRILDEAVYVRFTRAILHLFIRRNVVVDQAEPP